jgi:hypothetical protein
MKKYFIALLIGALFLQACKKTGLEVPSSSSLLVVNAAIGITSARVVATAQPFIWARTGSSNTIAFARSFQIGTLSGINNIIAVSAADTNTVLYNSTKAETLEAGTFNTFFLCGNTGAYEGIVINNENIPNYTDSVLGIRFINLSPNSSPVNITLSTTASVNEVTGLAYKQITNFKTYPALSSTGNMIFQIRNDGGILLATYTLPVTPVSPFTTAGIPWARFKNLTLVIQGLQGTTTGSNALGMFPVPHY